MAVITTPKKVSVNVKLDNGTDDKGNVRTVNLSLGNLSLSGFDAAKAMAVVNLIKPCLCHTVYNVEKVEVSDLEEE